MNFTEFLYLAPLFVRHIIIARGCAFQSWANPWSLLCRTTAPVAISAFITARLKPSFLWLRTPPDADMQNGLWSSRKIGVLVACHVLVRAQPMRYMR